jgi:hypothetical protein
MSIAILFVLLSVLVFSVYIPSVQHFIVSKIERSVGESLDADVKIGFFDLSYFADINLENIEITKKKDTLLVLEKLTVDIAFKPILRHKIVINDLQLTGMNTQLDQLIGYNDTTQTVEDSEPTTEDSWEIQLNHISINNSSLALYDTESKMDLQIEVGKGSIGKLTIDSFAYKAADIRLEDSRVSYVSPNIIEEVEDTSEIDFIITSNKVVFINSEFYYNDSLMTFVTGGKYVFADNLYVNVGNEKVRMSNAEMEDSYFNLEYINDTLEIPYTPLLWQVNVDKAKITNSKFIYDIPYLPENKEAFDYNHIHFTEMSAEAEDIFYSEPKISLSLLSGAFNENNRVRIESSSGQLFMDTTKIQFTNLKVETDNGYLAMQGALGYNVVIFDFRDNGELDLQVQYETKKTNSWNDLDYFVGDYIGEIPNLNLVRNKPLEMSSSVCGYYDSLQIKIDVVYDNYTKFKGEASVENATQEQGMKYDMSIANLELPKSSIALFVNQDELEYVPKKSKFNGTVHGTETMTKVRGTMLSDYGSQNIFATVDLSDSIPKIVTQFEGSVSVGRFYDFSVDTIYFDGALQGYELSQLLANGEVKMHGIHIDTLFYDSLNADFTIENQQYNIAVYSFDKHADFVIHSNGMLSDSTIESQTDFDITNFSFKESGVFDSPENIKLKSQIALDFNFINNNANVDANFQNLALTDSSGLNKIKELNIDFNYDNDITDFILLSDHNTIKVNVDGSLDTLINNFQKFIDILVLEDEQTNSDGLFFPNVKVYAKISNPHEFLGKNISDSIPEFSSLLLDASFDNSDNSLNIDLSVPQLSYQSVELDSALFILKGDLQGFDYSFESAVLLDSMLDVKVKIDGDFKHRKLKTHFNIWDRNRNDFIDFVVMSQEEGVGYKLSIVGDTMTILSNHWHINQPNSLQLKKDDIVANNILLHRADKEIRITTDAAKKDISLVLKNIELAVFNHVLSNDSLLAGYANLRLNSSFQKELTQISIVAKVDSFRYENYYLGDINIPKAQINEQEFAFDAGIRSAIGSSTAKGSIKFNEKNDLDITVDINSLNLEFLNTTLKEYLYNVKGQLNAEIRVLGNMEEPQTNGFVQFNDAQFGLADLQEEYRFNNQKVLFVNNKVDPSRLMIFDHNKHKAYFQGDLSIHENNFKFENFHIISNEFELMNSTKKDNETINGLVVSNIDIKLNGYLDDLDAKSKIELDFPTVVNYTFPEDLSVSSSDGIVNFNKIDTLNIMDSIVVKALEERHAHLMNIFRDLDAELVVKEGCKFNIYFDNTGDNYVNVMVKGDLKYLFSGETTLTSGLLNIVKGKMNYSMPMVSMKELNVSDDSYIQVTNDMSNPFISINASSKIWAQTGDLVENYNRNLEVTVFVYMRGTLDNLLVQFDVSPQTSDALISSKIAQMTEKERTMNAVNLLIRGQFASKQSTMTIDVDSYVNTLIAKALNKLISDRVKFVDMGFDIKSFNNIKSNGAVESQSNLFFNVGKSFYNDRIRINYRSNMTSSMTQQAGQYGSTDSYTERNFTVEYDITKSGDFQGVFFVKDSYEDIMEGDISSTGGGFKIRKTYKSFGDLIRLKPAK